MKRLFHKLNLILLLAGIIAGCCSCAEETTVPVSFYYRSYTPLVTEYTGLEDSQYDPADGSQKIDPNNSENSNNNDNPDNKAGIANDKDENSRINFLYEDICFEKDGDIGPDIDYPFTCVSAGCFDLDEKKVIYSRNAYKKIYPASTTKLLTALIAIKYLDLDDTILITEDNCGITTPGAKLCGFRAGDMLSVRDMLYCMLIYSGNDAATAIAQKVSGSEKEFAKLMNAEAAKIGAKDTHFTNPHGLHDLNHYTTAYDIYLIFNECLKDPFLKQAFKTTDYYATITNVKGEVNNIYMEPTNLYFMGKFKAPEGITVYGGKTGITSAAGGCLIIYSENTEGKGFITEVFKAVDKDAIYKEMNELLKLCK
ncbi:MAG: serine hydrolase [Lachnospiraceae bacterium]|nr:serine hydrolase [Lachnospiraceae bacterium]